MADIIVMDMVNVNVVFGLTPQPPLQRRGGSVVINYVHNNNDMINVHYRNAARIERYARKASAPSSYRRACDDRRRKSLERGAY